MAHWSSSGPPETFSLPLSPLCLWIHGPFPAIEFVMAPSSPLPNSGDPGATLACARLIFGDLTAAERSSAARIHSTLSDPLEPLPPSDPDRMARTPSDPCSHLFPLWRWTRSVSALSPSVADTPGPPVSAHPPARTCPRPQI
jgi:hypothetical protein